MCSCSKTNKLGVLTLLSWLILGLATRVSQAKPLSEGSPVDLGLQFRIRPEYRGNTDYRGDRSYYLLRLRGHLDYRYDPSLRIFVQPQFAKTFGDIDYLGVSPTQNRLQETSGAFYDPPLTVHQAYLDYSLWPTLKLIAGRQMLSYGDEILIGALLKWANVGRSFDAIKWVFTPTQSWQSDFFWSRVVSTGGFELPNTGNRDFSGLYQQFHLHPAIKNWDLYLLYLSDSRPQVSLFVWTLGTRVQSTINQFDYRFEVDYQCGQNVTLGNQIQQRPVFAHQEDAELGWTVDPELDWRLSLQGFLASPDFNQLFPAAHRWLGTADVLGRRNIVGAGLKSSVAFSPVSSASLAVYRFYRQSRRYPAYQLRGTTPLGSPEKSQSTAIGTEFDLVVNYQPTPPVMLSAGISALLSDTYLIQNYGSINPVYAFIELEASY